MIQKKVDQTSLVVNLIMTESDNAKKNLTNNLLKAKKDNNNKSNE